MDPFEHFDQQERSWSHLEEHGARLAREATEILATSPDAELAGVILEAGTREYASFRIQLAQATGQEVAPPVLVGLVPRDVMVRLAGADAAAWIAENAPPYERRLPVLAVLKAGMRLATFAVPHPPERE